MGTDFAEGGQMAEIRKKTRTRERRYSERALLGARFREIRTSQRYTRKSLANALKDRFGYPVISRHRIQLIEERGAEPGFLEIVKVAELTGVSIDSFMDKPYGSPPISNLES